MSAYGLNDVIELRNPDSEEELFNKVLLATEEKLAWLGYMWSPTKAASTLDLTRLVEPNCGVGQNPEDGCGYDDSRVRIAVHRAWLPKLPIWSSCSENGTSKSPRCSWRRDASKRLVEVSRKRLCAI